MRLLLDTHVFIWWDSAAKLSPRVLALCQDRENTLLLSVVSAWEIQVKLQLGRLKLHMPLSDLIEGQRETNALEVLPIVLDHVLALDALPVHHKDPFDRLLLAQSAVEDVVLVSKDSVFTNYPVKVIW
ncbi:MAG: type II toxin-antitoxin system VapC family toxin [Desulfovibrionales bacterium]|nr:type II toxin-antitoxin system VapC family toxin [Desulfovibrionales bacterium]